MRLPEPLRGFQACSRDGEGPLTLLTTAMAPSSVALEDTAQLMGKEKGFICPRGWGPWAPSRTGAAMLLSA